MPRTKTRYREALRGMTSLLRSPENPVVVPPGAPATVEVGMGAGHVLLRRAEADPARFFVGLEIKEERAYQAARVAAEKLLANLVFVVGEISRVGTALPSQGFDELLMLFPDPWPKKKDVARRLFAPRYLTIFSRWMKPGARGVLRSDNPQVLELALAGLAGAGCLISAFSADVPPDDVQTRYESRFRQEALRIGEIRFAWPAAVELPLLAAPALR